MVAFSRINGAIDLLFHQINPLANGRRLMESSVLPERMLKSDEFRSKGLIFVGLFRIGRSARGRFSRICSVLKGCKVVDKIGGDSKLDLKPISLFDQRVSTSNLKLSLGSKSILDFETISLNILTLNTLYFYSIYVRVTLTKMLIESISAKYTLIAICRMCTRSKS